MTTNLRDLLLQVSTATLTTQLLKKFGLRNTSLRQVRPIDADNCRFVGPAYTVRYIPLREDLLPAQFLDHPENKLTPAIEAIPAGAVLVLDANQRSDVGLLGGNIVARLKARGVAAVVTDGGMRDVKEIEEIGLSVFVREFAPPPSFTELMVADVQAPVSCAGVSVFPGDWVAGDADGVVVVPAAMAREAALAGAKMDDLEAYVLARLRRGEPMPGLYPPCAQVVADYDEWVRRGRPAMG